MRLFGTLRSDGERLAASWTLRAKGLVGHPRFIERNIHRALWTGCVHFFTSTRYLSARPEIEEPPWRTGVYSRSSPRESMSSDVPRPESFNWRFEGLVANESPSSRVIVPSLIIRSIT